MGKKKNVKYWQNFGEYTSSDASKVKENVEFPNSLLFEAEESAKEGKSFLEKPAPRRDFLKYVGYGTAAATIAASCKVPVRKAIPLLDVPEDFVPGLSYNYATTCLQDGQNISVVAKVRDGRPIKIEGNEECPITKGGTSATVQASVLDLYDGYRLRYPLAKGKEATFEEVDNAINGALNANPNNAVLLTSTINSPTTLELIEKFLAKYPNSRHITYDMDFEGATLIAENEACYGRKYIPAYRFDKAKVVLSVQCDFLGTWLNPIEYANLFATGRKIDEKNPQMNKLIHVGYLPSLTSSNADDNFVMKIKDTKYFLLAVYNVLKGLPIDNIIQDSKQKEIVLYVAKQLNDNKSKALVVAGLHYNKFRVLVNAINDLLDANGNTIDWSTSLNAYKTVGNQEFQALVDDMLAGKVSTMFFYNTNPVYSLRQSDAFVKALSKVNMKVSFNSKLDETSVLCDYQIPDHHYLESWGDVELKSNHFSFLQPTIYPLFKTRQFQDSLINLLGYNTPYADYLTEYWTRKLGSQDEWHKTIQKGIYYIDKPGYAPSVQSKAEQRLQEILLSWVDEIKKIDSNKFEIVLYKKIGVPLTYQSANPWLHELPDPITRATWDNYALMSPQMAKNELGIDISDRYQADRYETNPKKPVIQIDVDGQSFMLPVLILPGIASNVIGIAMGYGRGASSSVNSEVSTDSTIEIAKKRLGPGVAAIGFNIFPVLKNSNFDLWLQNVNIKPVDKKYKVALTQTHNSYKNIQYGDRVEVAKEMTLADFIEKPSEILEDREKEYKPYGGLERYTEDATMYHPYDNPGIKWGMNIDLNLCNGCGACVVACVAENNIVVVGKDEVARYHDMQWIRIDRYYSGEDTNNTKVLFEPMLCQQCDNAPCENVCPVGATNHSSEGLNQMTYNRCIGTRYCANNCPYKVRRFNWADYNGADSFPDNQREVLSDVVMYMNTDLPRMVLNPDVTCRSRGVMEKCTFCAQRLQQGKLDAKKESRPLETGKDGKWDVKVACQQACPTKAIVFGNVNDKDSAITQVRKDNPYRTFKVLEQLHTLPNITYLAKVRNATDVV
ncbi:MAG: 4Fe-4S dicluster domain-containing protein [Phycisphaerales bacterium]|nr:4Fe-4S dicluster domain-containing protein [Phycisphaerales bacterium]